MVNGIIKLVFYLFLMSEATFYVSCTICGVTICRRQNKQDDFIFCDVGRILVENVTNFDRTKENIWALKSLRRICTGKTTKCDVYQICQNARNIDLRVTYTCNHLPQSEPVETCTGDIRILNQNQGFILSPRYPDITLVSCSWQVSVQSGQYAVVKLHDLERPKVDRDSGLQIRTSHACPNDSIPTGLIYELNDNSNVYKACGDVDIDLITNGISGLRFWISYEVLPLYSSHPREYKTTYSCPAGTETEQEVQRAHVMPPGVPPIIITRKINVLNTTLHIDNETVINKIETRSTNSINTAERMIFYVAIAIAFLSLQALIVVIVVCIRRQRHLKSNGPVIDHSSIPSTYPSSFNSNRPLPPVQSTHVQLSNSPSLMDGYGVVADEIGGCFEQSSDSAAYAEVDDTLPIRPTNFRYSIERPRLHEPIENVYSELKDHDKNGYCEIADPVWHNVILSQNDQAKLLKGDKSRRSQLSNHSGKSRPPSFDGPFAHFNGKENRKSQPSEQSESDDSLFGDEQYDYIESAHV